MTILFELLDGSYDILFLSIYISTLTGVTLGSMWGHLVKETPSYIHHRSVHFPILEEGRILQTNEVFLFQDLIHWLQRTVGRKEATDESDYFLFIRS